MSELNTSIKQPLIGSSSVGQTLKAQPIWEGREFAAAALDALKGLPKAVGVKLKKTEIYTRLTEAVDSPEIQSTTTKKQKQKINNIINKIKQVSKSTEPGTLGTNIKDLIKTKFRLKEGIEQERSQALGIIDGALRSDIKPETKEALLKLLNEILSDDQVSDETKKQITDYINHMISDKENGWPHNVCTQAAKTFYQEGSPFVNDIDSKFNHETFEFTGDNKTLLLLQAIIHSSEEIPEWALKLLVGAANQTETSVASVNQATVKQFPDWLSEVMRGIKPDAFKKIAEQIVNCDENQWKDLTGTDDNAPENMTDSADKNIPDKLDTIATLALAALPKDDSKINEKSMPFTALNKLLLIKSETPKPNGPNIVAHIGKALVDADCNNPTWTNSRTTAFLKALNAIYSTKTQEELGKSSSEMGKDALLLCRSKLEGNAYKFDVAIQYVADDESEQKQKNGKDESSAQNPTPITSFFVDCLSPAEEYKSIIADIQSFQNYTGEPLYQFKPQTYEHIKNAMIMNHARKAYAFKKYQEYKGKQEASPNNDGIELDDQTIPTHSGEVEEKMGNDFNTWYNENKENIACDFNTWYSENKDGITTRLNSASDDIQNENTKVDIDGITLDRSSFQDQLQYIGQIDQSRYNTLSDEYIQNVTTNILSLAGNGKLEEGLINNNLFKSNYILEKSCSQLLTYLSNAENDQTKAHAKTALETILRHYCNNNERFANAKKELDNNNIQDATEEFIAALHSHNGSIKDINKETIQIQKLQQEQLQQAKTLFEKYRYLKNTNGTANNCLFYAICEQKPNNNNDSNYDVNALRQKYVEIQKADKTADEQKLQKEQAEISCLSQMATHLKRPIVVLVEQTATNQKGTGILLYLPNTEILLPPLSAENLDNNTTIETWLGNYNNHDAEFNAIAIALKTKVDDVKTMNVETALEILLGDSNTIALHFQGDTQNGHYQSFVPKNKESRGVVQYSNSLLKKKNSQVSIDELIRELDAELNKYKYKNVDKPIEITGYGTKVTLTSPQGYDGNLPSEINASAIMEQIVQENKSGNINFNNPITINISDWTIKISSQTEMLQVMNSGTPRQIQYNRDEKKEQQVPHVKIE